MSNEINEGYKVVLTPYEVEQLKELVQFTEAKLEYEKLVLKRFRDSRKVQSGEENINPDSGYVEDVFEVSTKLDYYRLLLSNYELANPQTDTVEIGSYVSAYIKGSKKECNFLVVQEARVPASQTSNIKLVSTESPIVSAILGKKVDEAFEYVKPNGEVASGFITELDNDFCNQKVSQKSLG